MAADDWLALRDRIEERSQILVGNVQSAADRLLAEIKTTTDDLLKEVEMAKQDENTKVLRTIVERLDRIEARLPEEEVV